MYRCGVSKGKKIPQSQSVLYYGCGQCSKTFPVTKHILSQGLICPLCLQETYHDLMEKVLDVFGPGKFLMTIFANKVSPAIACTVPVTDRMAVSGLGTCTDFHPHHAACLILADC